MLTPLLARYDVQRRKYLQTLFGCNIPLWEGWKLPYSAIPLYFPISNVEYTITDRHYFFKIIRCMNGDRKSRKIPNIHYDFF